MYVSSFFFFFYSEFIIYFISWVILILFPRIA